MFKDRLIAFSMRERPSERIYDSSSGELASLAESLATGDTPVVPVAPEEYYHDLLAALRGDSLQQLPLRKIGSAAATYMRDLISEKDSRRLLHTLITFAGKQHKGTLYKNLLLGCLSCVDIETQETEVLQSCMRKALPYISQRWQQRVQDFQLLDKPFGSFLSQLLLNASSQTLRAEIASESGLRNFQTSGLGVCVYRQLCSGLNKIAVAEHSSAEIQQAIEVWKQYSIMEKTDSDSTEFRVSSKDVKLGVDSILLPWLKRKPAAATKHSIQSILLSALDDPRTRSANWSAIDPDCVLLFKQWLALESFEVFIRVISKVAKVSHWQDRQDFWGWYLDENHVNEIWPVVGSKAALALDRINKEATDGRVLKFGRLSGASSDHCVMLMRVGNLTIAEWSHNGTVRFWHSDNPRMPKLYKQRYSGSQLRDHSNWGRVHQKGWQRDVNSYIDSAVGIRQPSW